VIDDAVLRTTLDRALRRGGDFADVFVEQRRSTSIAMEDSRIERVQAGTEQGAGIRVVCGLSTAFAYTDELTEAGLHRAAETAAAAARGGSDGAVIDLRERRVAEQTVAIPPDGVDMGRKVELLRAADAAAREESAAVRQVTATYA
jgi:TldD protein